MTDYQEKLFNTTPYRFKVELEYKNKEYTHVFYATHLLELSEKIEDKFPNSRIISVVGGGQ